MRNECGLGVAPEILGDLKTDQTWFLDQTD